MPALANKHRHHRPLTPPGPLKNEGLTCGRQCVTSGASGGGGDYSDAMAPPGRSRHSGPRGGQDG